MEEDLSIIICQLVDYLMPELTPYETALYLYLFRNSFLKKGNGEIQVGKRTIAAEFGRGARGEKSSYAHVSKYLNILEEKGCIKVNDITSKGTMYTVNLPKDIPLVFDKITKPSTQNSDADYFKDPEKRKEIFQRDDWICQYCRDKVTQESATLDHYIPQSKGGKNTKDNLKTSCLICNSIKCDKTYEEAAPRLLKNMQERNSKIHK